MAGKIIISPDVEYSGIHHPCKKSKKKQPLTSAAYKLTSASKEGKVIRERERETGK